MDNYELKQQNMNNNNKIMMNDDDGGLNGVGTCAELKKFNDIDATISSILVNGKFVVFVV